MCNNCDFRYENQIGRVQIMRRGIYNLISAILFLSACSSVDLDDGLITAKDLSFSGLYSPSEWEECPPLDEFFYSWVNVDKSSIVKSSVSNWRTPSCIEDKDDFIIEERIFLAENPRQAARIAENMKPGIVRDLEWLGDYETQLLSKGNTSIWLIRSKTDFENSRLILTVNDAVIYLYFFRIGKLVEDDLLELADVARRRLR